VPRSNQLSHIATKRRYYLPSGLCLSMEKNKKQGVCEEYLL